MSITDLNGPTVVLLARDEQESIRYYTNLGFRHESVGGHAHVSLGNVTFILHQAQEPGDVRPSSAVSGLYFDVFCYTGELKALYNQLVAKGVTISNGPHFGEGWSEFAMEDLNGYRIAFGGGL
jgi:uncharacterized glyoxalase superfamily protein PhnB